MKAVRLARVFVLFVLCLGLVGCGSEERAASSDAEIVPASAPAYVSFDTDVESDQWQRVETLLRKFPDGAQAITMLRGSFEEDANLDWEEDVKPALGDSLSLVWLDFENEGENVVGITKPKDEDKFREAVEKGNASDDGEDLLVGEIGGWLVLANSQARIDRFRTQAGEGQKLSDDAVFKDALAELPDDSILTAFTRGRELLDVFAGYAFLPGAGGLSQLQAGERPEYIAAALAAEESGVRAVSASRTEAESTAPLQTYESKLLGDVPGDAVAFLTFRGGESVDRQFDQLPKEGLQELERMLGLKLEAITALFQNEVALYVRGGVPIPEITLLLEAADEQAALRTVNDVIEQVTRLQAAQPCDEPEEQAGVTVQCVEFEDFRLRYAAFDGKVVVTTGPQSIEEIRSGGPRLGDDDAFKDAREAAGLPDANGGFVWLDFEDGLPLVLGLADAADEDIPAEVRRNIEALRSLVAWAEQDGRTSSTELFLAID
jgi:hypothetical protein